MNKLYKTIRVLTLSPIMALWLLLVLNFELSGFFGRPAELFLGIFAFTLVPLSAYPLQRVFAKYRDRGRSGQRELAIVFTLCGYAIGMIGSLVMRSGAKILLIYLTYMLSGAQIALFSKCTEIKASGHACGVMGPLVGLWYFLGIRSVAAIVTLGLYLVAGFASVKMERHTVGEYLTGSLAAISAMFISIMILGLK